MNTPIKHGRRKRGNTGNTVKSFSLYKGEEDVSGMQPRTAGLPYMVETPTTPIKRLKRTYFSSHTKNS